MAFNPILAEVPRDTRRRLLRVEAIARRSGIWGNWTVIKRPYPHAIGWLGQCDAVKNDVFCVLTRRIPGALHLAIASLSGNRPSWPEAQRIKNELAGDDVMAVEIYPRECDVVDGADMYHLWALEKPLPINLASDTAGLPASAPAGAMGRQDG